MKKTLRERLDLHKVSRYAIAANAAQAFFAVGLVLYALFGREFGLSGMAERLLRLAITRSSPPTRCCRRGQRERHYARVEFDAATA